MTQVYRKSNRIMHEEFNLSQELKIIRQWYSLTQKSLGEYLGVNNLTVHKWELGKVRPRDKYLQEIQRLKARIESGADRMTEIKKLKTKKARAVKSTIVRMPRRSKKKTSLMQRVILFFKKKVTF